MKNITRILILLISVALISSCSADKTTSPTIVEESKMPLSIGNWWKYDVYEVDKNGEIVGSILNTFTITVDKRDSVEGRYAYILSADGRKPGGYGLTVDVANDGVYFLQPFFYKDFEQIEMDYWSVAIDYNNTNWEMFYLDQNLKERDIENSGYTKKIGENVGSEIIEYKGVNYSTMNILNIFDEDVVTKMINTNDTTIFRTMKTDTVEYQFVPGLGIYSYTRMDKTPNERHFKRKEILVDHYLK